MTGKIKLKEYGPKMADNIGVYMSKAKQKEIDYLVDLIKANKVLYYSGLAIITDEHYDYLEKTLKKLDPENPILSCVGFKKEWLR